MMGERVRQWEEGFDDGERGSKKWGGMWGFKQSHGALRFYFIQLICRHTPKERPLSLGKSNFSM